MTQSWPIRHQVKSAENGGRGLGEAGAESLERHLENVKIQNMRCPQMTSGDQPSAESQQTNGIGALAY